MSSTPRRQPRRAATATVTALEPRRLLSASVIDVMVLYTPQALAQAGSVAALDARVHRAVADANLALANSQVNATVRLVHEQAINYAESGVLQTDLDRLQQPGDGYLDTAQALRDRYGADLVSLWVGSGDEGGRAYQPDDLNNPQSDFGYGVVQEQYADDNYIFAHEIAHNLGAGHDRSDPSPRAIPYAYGKTFQLGNYTVGDIMSDTERVAYFSNPNVFFHGVPTGNPDNSNQPADNAGAMNQFAPIVANYRRTVVPDTTGPEAALGPVTVDLVHQTVNIRVDYADDTAVAVSSLGSGNVLVTGPNGFARKATFVGADFNSDGAQRVATYQVSTRGFSADPGAYRLNLQPNQVRDVYGHFAPASVLGAPGVDFANRSGPRFATAYDVGNLSGTWRFTGSIDLEDPTSFYRFTLSTPAQVTARLSGLSQDLNELLVQDRNGDGQVQNSEILSYPQTPGKSDENIRLRLAAGTYYLWIAPPGNQKSTYSLTLSTAPSSPASAGAISGNVYDDANGNGYRDAGDRGIPSLTVFEDLNSNGKLDRGEPTTVTNAAGAYTFANLAAGFYNVRPLIPAGWWQSNPPHNWGQHVTLAPGQIVTARDFGLLRPASVSGTVFNDTNGDRLRQTRETGLPSWRVFVDLNRDGAYEPNEPSTLTNSAGAFSFADLFAGTYVVRAVQPSGWHSTTGGLTVTVTSGQATSGKLFGERKG